MSVKGATPMSEMLAAATIGLLREPRRQQRLSLVRHHGGFSGALREIAHRRADISRAKAFLDRTRDAGFDPVCLTDPGYPRLLRAAPDPPFMISVWGELTQEDALAVAIVGSRRASRYGLEMSQGLSGALSATGLTIVSGLARGIDAAAHRGALERGGRTIAVLGSGLGNIYPREHRRLAQQIAQRGAVISEFDINEPPRPRNFPQRNRIITGMSLGTLVVEAALKSGSLVSARIAMEQNREVYAVPGPALSPNSEGVHALIRDGATLVTKARDVLDELRPEIRALLDDRRSEVIPQGPQGPQADRLNSDALDPAERLVLDHLTLVQAAIDVDSLLDELELSVEQAMAALCGLEMKGRIWSLAGGLYQVRP